MVEGDSVLQILITGTNRGLGHSLALRFLERGHRVFAVNRKISAEVERLLDVYPDSYFPFSGDVSSDKDMAEAVRSFRVAAAPWGGGLDLLVNNAAIHLENHRPDLADIRLDDVQRSLTVNAVGPLRVTLSFLADLRRGKLRRIANISSDAGSIGNCRAETWLGYGMSKAALNMQSVILQNRLKREGFKVLAIHPGWFSSDMGGEEAPLTPEEAADNVARVILREWTLDDPVYVDFRGKAIAF